VGQASLVGRAAVPAIDALAPRLRLPMNDSCLLPPTQMPHYNEREARKDGGHGGPPY